MRLGAWVRGAAILMAAALVTTFVLVLILNAYAFPVRGLTGARIALLVVLGVTGALALALPLIAAESAAVGCGGGGGASGAGAAADYVLREAGGGRRSFY